MFKLDLRGDALETASRKRKQDNGLELAEKIILEIVKNVTESGQGDDRVTDIEKRVKDIFKPEPRREWKAMMKSIAEEINPLLKAKV